LELTRAEIDTLTALAPWLGGSPRRARRFVNIYRVAKASLGPAELLDLEESGHRALATQLAIATGAPSAFGAWAELCAVATDDTIEERVRQLPIAPEERANILGAMAVFRSGIGGAGGVAAPLAEKAMQAARFSFAFPPRTPSGESGGIDPTS
jgi:hypothetical protein